MALRSLETLGLTPGGFTLSYTVGPNRYAALSCRFSEDDISVDNGAGNVEVSENFTGTERIRLS